MNYRVRYTRAAKDDLVRLYGFFVERDVDAARKALSSIEKGIEFLKEFPFTCRKATPDDPLLREMIISFGSTFFLKLRTVRQSLF